MAVSSCRNALLRYSMTLGSPFISTPCDDRPMGARTSADWNNSREGIWFQPVPICGVHRRFSGINARNSGGLMAGAAIAGGGRRIERLVHDLADGAGAA